MTRNLALILALLAPLPLAAQEAGHDAHAGHAMMGES